MSLAPGQNAIEVRDLKKTFRLRTTGANSLKTALLWRKKKSYIRELEVLKGISFDVGAGECVAVIGRNGAGKSTLLSLLARVYKPDSGSIKINGRVAPLLELGAGFHPDLTGIENIRFNGIILGLTRAEVEDRIDSIVEFAELRSHIDSPTRTYSSGMMARLGFAVAVHVDADILMIDEVLSVGDYEFREKCTKKIESFQKAGGSILFVSHSTDSVTEIADRCIWLHKGLVRRVGEPDLVAADYEATPMDTDTAQ